MNNNRRYIVALSTIILMAAVTFILIIKGNANETVSGEQPGTEIIASQEKEILVETSLFQSEEGWGYEIYIDGKKYINQPIIPVIQGNKAFASESDAMKVAELMADKIRNNIIPPTVSIEELDSLDIQK